MATHLEHLLTAQGIQQVVIKLSERYMAVVDPRFGLME